jgi:hypothetical protein
VKAHRLYCVETNVNLNATGFSFYYSFRAIDMKIELGNIGGYIELCVGDTLLQMPDLISYDTRNVENSLQKGDIIQMK